MVLCALVWWLMITVYDTLSIVLAAWSARCSWREMTCSYFTVTEHALLKWQLKLEVKVVTSAYSLDGSACAWQHNYAFLLMMCRLSGIWQCVHITSTTLLLHFTAAKRDVSNIGTWSSTKTDHYISKTFATCVALQFINRKVFHATCIWFALPLLKHIYISVKALALTYRRWFLSYSVFLTTLTFTA